MKKEYPIKHKVLKDGTEKWTRYNPNTRKHEFHRLNGPAHIDPYGTKTYYENGKIHRKKGPAITYEYSNKKEWYVNGERHREDGPAITSHNGKHKEWYINGKRHREDGPAYIYGDLKEWYINGKRHREDGPAVIDESRGTEEWYVNGERHREDGPARYVTPNPDISKYIDKAIKDIDKVISEETNVSKLVKKLDNLIDYNKSVGKVGSEIYDEDHDVEWFKNGIRHREDGPAHIDCEGTQRWYINGELHRLDGPAVVYTDEENNEWYKDGLLHREDGPAKTDYGVDEWYIKGELHREDGPARIHREYNGRCEWYLNGNLHRKDGPAIYNDDTIENGDELSITNIAEEFKDLLIKVKNAKDVGEYRTLISDAQSKYCDLEDTLSEMRDEVYDGYERDPDELDFGYFYHGKQITKDELVIVDVGLGDLL
jgi:hypothetical protein